MPADTRIGLWLLGARGSVATTALVGAAALAAGLARETALVSSLPCFAHAGLAPLTGLVFGGHDVADTPLRKRAEILADGNVIPRGLTEAVADVLDAAEADLRPGVGPPGVAGEAPEAAADRVRTDLEAFRARYGLDRVVVVNVSSTEPPVAPGPLPGTIAELRSRIGGSWDACPQSLVYAHGAITAGCGFVDFTPGLATRVPALQALAREHGVPYAGRDGKTGETLVKTALAPMFADRALRVLSWSGTNLLGGGDGATLASPAHARSKLEAKGVSLAEILGYRISNPVHIDFLPDLGEWKTAWDHINFEGFLGTRMRMQFTWEGCDSALAAPLVLDLARLVARAHAAGQAGVQPALAFFFKDPVGTREHRLGQQFADLCEWVAAIA